MGTWKGLIDLIALDPEQDARQALRIRRYLMGAGTSLMVIALLSVAYWSGGWNGPG